MKKTITYTAVLAMIFLFFTSITSAQKKLDSVLTVTANKIFDDPNKVILIGHDVFSNATQAKTKINALMLISNAYLSKRENSKSLEYALKTREYLPQISSKKTQINILNTIGMQHQQLRIYDKAIEYLDEALLLSKRIKNPDSLPSVLGYNYTIRGFIYREQMSCDIALNYFDKAIFQFKKISARSTMTANLSTLTYNKGNCFLQISQIDSARVNFNKSIEYAQTVGANSLLAFAKKGLSEVFTAEGNYHQAIKELNEAENASKQVGDLILNQGIYKNLSDNYLAINNRDLYKESFKKYEDVQKQINEKEQGTINTSINNLIEENNSETEKKLSNLKIVQWILIGGCIFIFLIMGKFVLKNHREFRKAKEKLETLKV